MATHRTDGHLVQLTDADLVKGNVVRAVYPDGGQAAFSDALILDVYYKDRHGVRLRDAEVEVFKGTKYVKLARPYAFVFGAIACCPTVLTGVEQYEIEAVRLLDTPWYKLVVQSTGKAANYTT